MLTRLVLSFNFWTNTKGTKNEVMVNWAKVATEGGVV